MLFNFAPDLQLEYNRITETANLIVGQSGTKDACIYGIDTIMFNEMLSTIKLAKDGNKTTPVTIKSPYVNNGDTITVVRGEGYFRVVFKGTFIPHGTTYSRGIEKNFHLKEEYVDVFCRTLKGNFN